MSRDLFVPFGVMPHVPVVVHTHLGPPPPPPLPIPPTSVESIFQIVFPNHTPNFDTRSNFDVIVAIPSNHHGIKFNPLQVPGDLTSVKLETIDLSKTNFLFESCPVLKGSLTVASIVSTLALSTINGSSVAVSDLMFGLGEVYINSAKHLF